MIFLPIHSLSENSSIQVTDKSIETEISSKSIDLTNPTSEKREKDLSDDLSINFKSLVNIYSQIFPKLKMS